MSPSPEEIAAAAHQQATAAGTAIAPQAEEQPAVQEAVTVTHKEPILASGAAGPIVRKLVDLLAVCGHATNTIITGDNPGGVLDNSVMSDVRAFRTQYDITEDPGLEIAGDFIGPYTWQALYEHAQQAVGLS
jgi:hypothetical protein